jgi:hypothetical protein
LYTFIKIEKEICWNCSKKGRRGMSENDGGGESNLDTL